MTCTHFPTNANVFITVFTYSSTATMHEARPIITSDALATRILQECNTSHSRSTMQWRVLAVIALVAALPFTFAGTNIVEPKTGTIVDMTWLDVTLFCVVLRSY